MSAVTMERLGPSPNFQVQFPDTVYGSRAHWSMNEVEAQPLRNHTAVSPQAHMANVLRFFSRGSEK